MEVREMKNFRALPNLATLSAGSGWGPVFRGRGDLPSGGPGLGITPPSKW